MTTQTMDLHRPVPRFGGFNATLLRLELSRVVRNKRTMLFTLIFPAAMFLAFGTSAASTEDVGHGNVSAYIMVSMGLYAAALTAAVAGAMVAVERALGWSRQLRLTPLKPVAYVSTKAIVALFSGSLAVVVVNATGLVQGTPSMPWTRWLACALVTLVCTTTFAALGVFVGYLVPSENVMQILSPGLAVLGFLGGLFIPITAHSGIWWVAIFTPMYGVAEVARAPLTGELPWYAVVNAVLWCALFVAGAAWRMSKDTSRV
jgi:ABC-2 type transport system permease protein